MSIPSTSFSLQVQSPEDVEEWILVLVKALRQKSKRWHLKIVQGDNGDLFFECSPSLTNEEVSLAFISSRA
ncbi:MAG: hypothetical protein V3W22_07040 [Thermoplasmata archaeon]